MYAPAAGFGKAAAPAPGFGAPVAPVAAAAAGFGAPAAGGFGAPSAAAAPAAAGFGAPAAAPAAGFGAPAAAPAAGFGAPAAAVPPAAGFAVPGAAPAAPAAGFGVAPVAGAAAAGFSHHHLQVQSQKDPRAKVSYHSKCITNASALVGTPTQNYTLEMLHMDELLAASGNASAPMATFLQVNPQNYYQAGSTKGAAHAPSAGFAKGAAAAPVTAGFGKQPAAAGFGAAAAAPAAGFAAKAPAAGFGAAPAAPAAGFGAKAPAAGGFGAPAAAGGFGGPSCCACRWFRSCSWGVRRSCSRRSWCIWGSCSPRSWCLWGSCCARSWCIRRKSPCRRYRRSSGCTRCRVWCSPAATGFGAAPAATGFGAPAAGAAPAFGAPAAAPAAGGFGFGGAAPAAPAAGGFGFGGAAAPAAPAGGFGFGAPAAGAAPASNPNVVSLPDFTDKPYGNMLLYCATADDKPIESSRPVELPGSSTMVRAVPPPPLTLSATIASGSGPTAARHGAELPHPSMQGVKQISAAALRAATSRDAISLGGPGPAGSRHHDATADATPSRALLRSSILSSPTATTAEPSALLGAPPTGLAAPTVADQQLGGPPAALPRKRGGGTSPLPESLAATQGIHAPRLQARDLVLTPSLAELSQMSAAELASVNHFSIARADGRTVVNFLEPVNLQRCPIDDCIEIDGGGRVHFYPRTAKPPLGTGLMTTARVTVRHMTGATTRELQKYCTKHSLLFEAYSRGEWRYLVNLPEDGTIPGVAATVATSRRRQRAVSSSSSSSSRSSSYSSSASSVSPASLSSRSSSDEREVIDRGSSDEMPPPGSGYRVGDESLGISRHSALPVVPSVGAGVSPMVGSTPFFSSPGVVQAFGAPPSSSRTGASSAREHLGGGAGLAVGGGGQQAVPIVLPYELPTAAANRRTAGGGAGFMGAPQKSEIAFLPQHSPTSPHASPHRAPVYMIKKSASVTHAKMAQTPQSQRSRDPITALGRSFRVGWGPSSLIALPAFGAVKDNASDMKEVEKRGSSVAVFSPLPPVPPTTATQLLQNLDKVSNIVAPSSEDPSPKAEAVLRHPALHHQLSETKLAELLNHLPAEDTSLSSLQLQQAIELTSALYATSDDDMAAESPEEEEEFTNALRRRKMMSWLDKVVRGQGHQATTSTFATANAKDEATRRVLTALLEHRTHDATMAANDLNDPALAAIVAGCGKGNLAESFSVLSSESSELGLLIRLLTGEVEHFMREETYLALDEGTTTSTNVSPVANMLSRNPKALAWKQLLGIYFFYACPPSTPVAEVVRFFAERLSNVGTVDRQREEVAMPTYAISLSNDELKEKPRAADYIRRGRSFNDALLSLLVVFANADVPPAPTILHPHASSYLAHDYCTPFVLAVLLRAVGTPRTEAYMDYEHQAIMGLASQLDKPNLWHWAVFVLMFIEDPQRRSLAIHTLMAKHATEVRSHECDAFLERAGLSRSNFLKAESEYVQPEPTPMVNAPTLDTYRDLKLALDTWGHSGSDKR